MEDLFVGVLLPLVGALCWMVGRQMSPKNKTLAQTMKWYEDELGNMRTEVNRYRSKASYYAKGAVPSELVNVSGASALVDGIISALPPNWRRLAQQWKTPLIQYMEANPEVVSSMLEKIKGMVGGSSKGEQAAIADDAV